MEGKWPATVVEHGYLGNPGWNSKGMSNERLATRMDQENCWSGLLDLLVRIGGMQTNEP